MQVVMFSTLMGSLAFVIFSAMFALQLFLLLKFLRSPSRVGFVLTHTAAPALQA